MLSSDQRRGLLTRHLKNITNKHLRKLQSFISLNYSILLFLKGVSFIITILWIIKVNSLFVFFLSQLEITYKSDKSQGV